MSRRLERLDRGLISVCGEQARSFLQKLLTQDMRKVSPEQTLYSALLTPQGKVITDLFIFQTEEDSFFLDLPAPCLGDVLGLLRRYCLRAPVKIESTGTQWSLAVCPPSGDKKEEASEGHSWTEGQAYMCCDPRLDALGYRILMPKNYLRTTEETGDYQSRLFTLGLVEPGIDNPTSVYPFDVNLDALKALSFDKGCFVGQEVVSRMKRRGNIRKRLLPFNYEGSDCEEGELTNAEGLVIGKVWPSRTETKGQNRALIMTRLDRLEKSASSSLFLGKNQAFLTWPFWLPKGN